MKNEERKIFSSTDELMILQICALLEEKNIPYIKKISGAGGYLNISAGQTIEEKKIFVSEEDYDKAMEIIKELKASTYEELPDELKEFDEEENEEFIKEQRKSMDKIAFRFFMFLIIVGIMIFILS